MCDHRSTPRTVGQRTHPSLRPPHHTLVVQFRKTVIRTGEQKTNVLFSFAMPVRECEVSFKDHQGMKHAVVVEAETLNEAVVKAVVLFRKNPWIEVVNQTTPLLVEVRQPGSKHSLTLAHVEKWLASHGTPPEQARRARLKAMLVMGR